MVDDNKRTISSVLSMAAAYINTQCESVTSDCFRRKEGRKKEEKKREVFKGEWRLRKEKRSRKERRNNKESKGRQGFLTLVKLPAYIIRENRFYSSITQWSFRNATFHSSVHPWRIRKKKSLVAFLILSSKTQ